MFKRELKVNLRSLIIWLFIVSIMIIMVYAIYPFIITEENVKMLDEMMKMFPEDILKAFNMDMSSISSVYGWIKTEGYTFITLFGGIFSSVLGCNILSREEKDKTIEFLISKPITRNKIVTTKIISAVIYIFIFTIVVFIINLIGLSLSKELIFKELLLISFAPIILYLLLFFISLATTTFIKNYKKITSIGLAITFVSYIFQLIGLMSSKVDILRQISPFEFISIRYLLDNGHVNYIYLLIAVVIIAICTMATYTKYNEKELI